MPTRSAIPTGGEIGGFDLARLTFTKSAVNTGIRWLPFFLPTLALAFNSSTGELGVLLGIAEGAGLCTLFLGRLLDAGRERILLIASMGGLAVSSLLALTGRFWLLAVAAVVLGAASAIVTVSGHAWIAARVDFARRSRFIGIYEMSWASALLIGVPFVAVLINVFGWRGPFVAVIGAGALAAFGIATMRDRRVTEQPVAADAHVDSPTTARTPLTFDAWLIVVAAAGTALTGLATIVVAGTWLDEVLGVSTGGVGLVAMAFGAAELLGSSSSSAFADRLGKRITTLTAMIAALIGLGFIVSAGTSLLVGAIGLCIFFVGFEYAIVTSFALVSEAMPNARGGALAVGHAVSTVSRGVGAAVAGFLYEWVGIEGPAALSAGAAVITIGLLIAVGRHRPDMR